MVRSAFRILRVYAVLKTVMKLVNTVLSPLPASFRAVSHVVNVSNPSENEREGGREGDLSAVRCGAVGG